MIEATGHLLHLDLVGDRSQASNCEEVLLGLQAQLSLVCSAKDQQLCGGAITLGLNGFQKDPVLQPLPFLLLRTFRRVPPKPFAVRELQRTQALSVELPVVPGPLPVRAARRHRRRGASLGGDTLRHLLPRVARVVCHCHISGSLPPPSLSCILSLAG